MYEPLESDSPFSSGFSQGEALFAFIVVEYLCARE